MKIKKNLASKYNPLYFLTSLGAGGISVSFFVYLQFMIPHKDTPIVTFNHIINYINEINIISIGIIGCLLSMLIFGIIHLYLLSWNIKEYNLFKKHVAHEQLIKSNAGITLMAIPLTYAMTINVMFALGASYIPNLWLIVEYLFPFAIIGFLMVGLYALNIFINYVLRLFNNPKYFSFEKNGNLSQMIAVFTFSMIAVGFSAPVAMSENIVVNAIALFLSLMFLTISVVLFLFLIIMGIKSIMKHGITNGMEVSFWLPIPILTLIGITVIRQWHGLSHNLSPLHSTIESPSLLVLTSVIVSSQLLIGYFGYKIMSNVEYYKSQFNIKNPSPSIGAIVCPMVAFTVFGSFFIHLGLVSNNIIEKFSISYFIIYTPFIIIQIVTLISFFKIYKNLLQK